VCMYACVHAWMYVCMYVIYVIYLFMYVCMYVCMYVYMYVCILNYTMGIRTHVNTDSKCLFACRTSMHVYVNLCYA
jgi:hypothetical protein